MSPEMINVFLYLKKNEFLMLTEGYPPRPVSQNYEKNTLPWKPMELGGVREKKNVWSSARNWVYYMYKGIYVIPFGE